VSLASARAALERLIKLNGVGNWTVDVYLIIVLHRLDLFPAGDLAAVNGLKELKGRPRTAPIEELVTATQLWARIAPSGRCSSGTSTCHEGPHAATRDGVGVGERFSLERTSGLPAAHRRGPGGWRQDPGLATLRSLRQWSPRPHFRLRVSVTGGSMAADQLFELRTYHAAPGKLDALKARFANHSLRLFAKHGVTVMGFWVARDADGRPSSDFVYLLAFQNSEAREQSWEAFRTDPDWLVARADSEANGPIITSAESVLLDPAEYSLLP
jgi:hypothetical protein